MAELVRSTRCFLIRTISSFQSRSEHAPVPAHNEQRRPMLNQRATKEGGALANKKNAPIDCRTILTSLSLSSSTLFLQQKTGPRVHRGLRRGRAAAFSQV